MKTKTILITVSGGVAEIASRIPKGIDVDILDFDNLKDTSPGDAILSDVEWSYLKKNCPNEYKRLKG